MIAVVYSCIMFDHQLVLQWNTWSKDSEHDHQYYNKDEVAAGVQNFLICIEMFFAALAHAYAFPPKDYMDPSWNPSRGLAYSLRVMFDVRDVVDDVEGVVNDTVRQQMPKLVCLLPGTVSMVLQHVHTACSSLQHQCFEGNNYQALPFILPWFACCCLQ